VALTVLLVRIRAARRLEVSRVVESSPVLKKDWVLTQEALNLLLSCLDPDSARAAQKYENIRQGLITFFECRGSSFPEDHADETIDRVARRLAEGKEIYVENPASYFYGVARNVLKEHWESAHSVSAAIENFAASRTLSDDPHQTGVQQFERHQKEQRLEYLEHCLAELDAADRQLICEYYQGTTSIKIRNRKLLAQRLGIPMNALRIRALRVREKLEECVERQLQASRTDEISSGNPHSVEGKRIT
jgi:DNA-directed RNA polymerase specialized sigma24 family protein